jgi:hypothetical protein
MVRSIWDPGSGCVQVKASNHSVTVLIRVPYTVGCSIGTTVVESQMRFWTLQAIVTKQGQPFSTCKNCETFATDCERMRILLRRLFANPSQILAAKLGTKMRNYYEQLRTSQPHPNNLRRVYDGILCHSVTCCLEMCTRYSEMITCLYLEKNKKTK